MVTVSFNVKTEEEDEDLYIRDVFSEIYDNTLPDVVREARNRAPVKTGALRRSLSVERRGATDAVVRDGVHYGRYQEFGTIYIQPPKRFVQSAIEDVFGSFEG